MHTYEYFKVKQTGNAQQKFPNLSPRLMFYYYYYYYIFNLKNWSFLHEFI